MESFSMCWLCANRLKIQEQQLETSNGLKASNCKCVICDYADADVFVSTGAILIALLKKIIDNG